PSERALFPANTLSTPGGRVLSRHIIRPGGTVAAVKAGSPHLAGFCGDRLFGRAPAGTGYSFTGDRVFVRRSAGEYIVPPSRSGVPGRTHCPPGLQVSQMQGGNAG